MSPTPRRSPIGATSNNTATATPIVITAGLIAAAGTEADADVTGDADTLASVGSSASITAPGAPVSVTANAHNHASATVTSASVAFASLQVMLPSATVAGATKATFDGDLNDVATDAQSLTVEAVAENQVTASVYIISVTIAGASGAVRDRHHRRRLHRRRRLPRGRQHRREHRIVCLDRDQRPRQGRRPYPGRR